jgi:alpha/beta superfamily hydrolase
MESPVVTELAHACERAGIESLRFNWRGVGASGGESTGDAGAATADYQASLDWIEESTPCPIVACGYSFGAAAAVRAAVGRARVRRLLLVAPPTALIDPDHFARFPGAVDVLVGDRDDFAPLAEVEKLVASLAKGRLEVIPDCDHFFMTGLAELGRAARSFLSKGSGH